MASRKLTARQQVAKAETALRELDLSTTTQADKKRLALCWAGLRALDDEQCDIKGAVSNLLDSLETGYSVTEVIEDLRVLVKRWDRESKAAIRGAV